MVFGIKEDSDNRFFSEFVKFVRMAREQARAGFESLSCIKSIQAIEFMLIFRLCPKNLLTGWAEEVGRMASTACE